MTAYVIRLKFLERCFTFEELGNVFQSFWAMHPSTAINVLLVEVQERFWVPR
jgi:hypothetical protein